MQEQKSFGVLLKKYRLEANLSQEALAARAGLSTRGISDLERGLKQKPRFDTLERLSDALSLSAQQQALLRALARPEMTPPPPASRSFPVSYINSLPHAPASLIGRKEERSFAVASLRSTSTRLLTITGPGGVGKTRLAMQMAEDLSADFSDGVAFVALASIRNAALLPEVLAQALGLREQVDMPMVEQVRSFLQHRQFLFVLDNFEHILEAAPSISDLLASCPHLRILVTSRTPLRLRAENVFPLAPLPLDDAIMLFSNRAQAVRPGGAYEGTTVAAICEQVDRLPLAIELAAMQVRLLSLTEVLERLSNRLAVLRGGARDMPARHQTMREAIAWSYELLTAEQQRCFRAMGVFVGGWTLEAAETIAWDQGDSTREEAILTLAALIDCSLVHVETQAQGPSRFGMLELIREYALDQLRMAGEEEICRWRHAAYYAHLGESIVPFGPERGVGETQLVQDFPNARTALQWVEEKSEVELGLRLASAFGRFWFSRGQMSEVEGWLERIWALDERVGEQRVPHVLRADALYVFGETLMMLGKLERTEAMASEALNRAQARLDYSTISMACAILGEVAQQRGKLDEAAAYFTESDMHARQTEYLSIRGTALSNRSEMARIQGDVALATTLAEEGLLQAQEMGITFIVAKFTIMLGRLALEQENYALAKTRYREALALCRTIGSPNFTAWCIEGFATTVIAEGYYIHATRLCAAAAALREQAHTPLPPAEQPAFELTIATAKEALGASTFEEEWTAGAVLTQDEAIDYALSARCK